MKTKRVQTIFFLLVSAVFCLVSTSVFAEQLVVPGTGASEVILQDLATAFNTENPDSEVIIPPSVGSGGGVRLVGMGEYDLGRVARPFKKAELDYGLKHLIFAKDVIVFAVGAKVGIDNLSSQQLVDVYSGRITNWKDVGGNDIPVRLLVRDLEDTSYKIINQHINLFKNIEFSGNAKIMFHDYEMVNALNKYSTVIGWISNSSLKAVDPLVKPIAIDNVAPTQQNVYDGNYFLTVEYAMVYKEGELSGLIKEFIEFIYSKKGNSILINAGLVPVNNQQY